jgi:type VI secretion system protein ImpA
MTMRRTINVDALLAAFAGENPSGTDLRYSREYDDIKEARRYDDPSDQGEWKTEIKKADWEKLIDVGVDALTKKTKDLQIAVWLTEALIMTEQFEGCAVGMRVINGLLRDFWDSLYPPLEDDDLEYRIAPLEFLNEKLWSSLAGVPLTDKGRTQGYSYLQWQESRKLGYDAEARSEEKRRKREEDMAEGKPTADQFDAAVAASPPGFYKSLSEALVSCTEEFKQLEALVDERFGKGAPRLEDFGRVIEESSRLVQKFCREKGLVAGPEPGAIDERAETPLSEDVAAPSASPVGTRAFSPSAVPSRGALVDTSPWEEALWEEALRTMKGGGITHALEKLTEASLSAPSPREQCRYKLLAAKLCLQGERPELARPVLEQLYSLIEQLHLENWESPVWIAEVLGALYQCLMTGEPSEQDLSRAQELFQRLCTMDMVKAAAFRR